MNSRLKKYLVELSKSHLVLMSEIELQEKIKKIENGKSFRVFHDESYSWVEARSFFHVPAEKRQWYYLKDHQAVGVFNELEMIRMVQSKKIHQTQLIWKPGMKLWTEFCRTTEFCPQNLKQLIADFPPLVESVFSKRKSNRVLFHADFILHDQDKIWKAKSFEIGAGGIGMQVHGRGLTIGQSVELHLISKGFLKNFTARAEVVSHLQDAKGIKPDRFGLKFIEIEKGDQQLLQQLLTTSSTKV